jgi:P27 family predicted phage terminase small subunit
MGRRGPPPKPTSLRRLEGNRARRPLPPDEPRPTPSRPTCPHWLGTVARREWRRVVPELERLGLIACVDGAALEAYCSSYEVMVLAAQQIARDGVTSTGIRGPVRHPALDAYQAGRRGVLEFCREFGLTPSARCRLHAPGETPAEDPMESLLSGTSANVTDLRALIDGPAAKGGDDAPGGGGRGA